MKRTIKLVGFLLLLGLGASACNDNSSPSENPVINSPEPASTDLDSPRNWPVQRTPLARAHEAFLDQNYREMVRLLHEVLTDPAVDRATYENALELLEVAYDDTGGRLPSPWSFPEGLLRLSVDQIRKVEPGQLSFQLLIRGWTRTPARVQSVMLRSEPDGEILLDRRTRRGAWSLHPDGEGNWEFELEGEERQTAAPEGVYTISLTLEDGTESSGWFFLSGMTSSATPVVRSPLPGAVLSDRKPVVQWDAFRSPEHRSFEGQSMGVWLLALDGTGPRWTLWTNQDVADMERVRLGEDPRGSRTGDLEDGNYWLALTFGEKRHFGPLTLNRVSRTALPFSIRASP